MAYSYKGKILISTPDISGDIFSRSVLLIIEHNTEGAFGLILNKINREITAKIKEMFGYDADVYEGGPVSNDKIFFIIRGEKFLENATGINDEYWLTEDIEEVVTAVIEERLSTDDMKIFSGYSGWTALQLENEILNKMWTVVDVVNLDYTEANDQTLWKKIMLNLGGEFLLWANAPEDISLN
ncbi:MAG: YqgE/AlgH family protein [Chryseobacterium sp.]|nr:MAG: YqgE/AlgH family protein [Chryseobacterium sp.]